MNILRPNLKGSSLEMWIFYAILAEAFFIALSPGLAKVALLCGVILWFVRLKTSTGMRFRHMPFDIPIAVFVLCGAASIAVSPDPAFSFYNYYNLVGVYVLTYLLVTQNVTRSEQVRLIAGALGLAALLAALYGCFQYVFGIDTSAMKWVDGDAFPELRKRVFSTWENPNIFAGYLDIVICMLFGLFVKSRNRKVRAGLLAGMVLLALCLAMTYARGACFSIMAVLAGYGIFKDRRVLIACIAIGGAILVLDPALANRLGSAFTKIDTSSEMRLALWESTIAMIQDHPLLGIGWGAYWMVYPEYDFYINNASVIIVHAHNLYLNYAAEIGIIGAAAYFYYFFGTMRLALASGKPHTEFSRGLSLGIGLAILSIALNGITDDVLFNIPSSMLLWLLCALAACIDKNI